MIDIHYLRVDPRDLPAIEPGRLQPDVLVLTRDGLTHVGSWDGCNWHEFDEDGANNRLDVIAWRPIPDWEEPRYKQDKTCGTCRHYSPTSPDDGNCLYFYLPQVERTTCSCSQYSEANPQKDRPI